MGYRDRPLWFPGSIGTRAVLAWGLVGALIGALFVLLLKAPGSDLATTVVGAVITLSGVAVNAYFNSRSTRDTSTNGG